MNFLCNQGDTGHLIMQLNSQTSLKPIFQKEGGGHTPPPMSAGAHISQHLKDSNTLSQINHGGH